MKTLHSVIPLRMGQLAEPFERYYKAVYGGNSGPPVSTLLKEFITLGMQAAVGKLPRKARRSIGDITKEPHGKEAHTNGNSRSNQESKRGRTHRPKKPSTRRKRPRVVKAAD